MEKFGRSQPANRLEDVRFLTGRGGYLDDTAPAGALRAVVLRAPMAHADITAIDLGPRGPRRACISCWIPRRCTRRA